jgi:uncharacterized protein (DUF1501 family)
MSSDRDISGSRFNRRDLLRRAGPGALLLLAPRVAGANPRGPHFTPKARSVVFLYMGGGPSHVDLFDPKPSLLKYEGRPIPQSITSRDLNASSKVLPSKFAFARAGRCGTEVSELLPHLAGVMDEIAVVRSAKTTRIDHSEALLVLHTGRPSSGFPTIGSWISYALGSENRNLPAYIAMPEGPSERTRNATSSGWLPQLHAGSPLNAEGGDPFFYLHPPSGTSTSSQSLYLELLSDLNERHLSTRSTSRMIARAESFKLASRMQVAAVKEVDISREPEAVRRMYGLDAEPTRSFGTRCLIARRLVESGVRFVHLMRSDWDHHGGPYGGIFEALTKSCVATDQPIAALIRDLKQRGLLESTLLVWVGEFGRLPVVEGGDGRDHNPFGFSLWMAGGGVKGGVVHGATDEFGYAAVDQPVSIADLHATILHLVGIDFAKLVVPFEGRDESLVGVEKARVVKEIIA